MEASAQKENTKRKKCCRQVITSVDEGRGVPFEFSKSQSLKAPVSMPPKQDDARMPKLTSKQAEEKGSRLTLRVLR